jgi:site-specific DNA-cytosine methylase
MDLGLEAAGFRHLGCIELDETARNSLKANRDGVWKLLEPGDISLLGRELQPSDLGLTQGDLGVLAVSPSPRLRSGRRLPVSDSAILEASA